MKTSHVKTKPLAAILLAAAIALPCAAQLNTPQLSANDQQLARGLLKQLIEINTSHTPQGGITAAAKAMQQRFLAAGFPAADVTVAGPIPAQQNLVVRYRGRANSGKRPILIIGHLDVVNANRSDWTVDPFQLTEKDGYLYGRGTQDMKECDAAFVFAFLKLYAERFTPDRDLILALTADEESGDNNGVDWLLKNRRPLVDAGFVLNPDMGGLTLEKGKPDFLGVEATEKLYADFKLTTTNPGGHSSIPRTPNAIYQLAAALTRISAYKFPTELNNVTRAYFAALAKTKTGQQAADMRAVAAPNPSPAAPSVSAAVARLSADPIYNALFRTTCVATLLTAGHAPNALPQHAEANINCRILPGHSPREVHQQLTRVVNDPAVTIQHVEDNPSHNGEDEKSTAPPPLNAEVFSALHAVVDQMWPGTPIIPEMETGASDSRVTMEAGIPSYGFSGMGVDKDDIRAHGQDERIRISAYYQGVDFTVRYLKTLTGK